VFPSIDDCYTVIHNCQAATDLYIGIGTLLFPHPPTMTNLINVIFLPNLQLFHIKSHGGISGFFDHFVFPHLLHLSIQLQRDIFEDDEEDGHCILDYPAWPQMAVSLFFRQSSCHITSLRLNQINLTFSDTMELLSAAGEFLEIIHISSFQAIMAEYSSMCCVDDNMLEFLTWNDLDPLQTCPRLSQQFLTTRMSAYYDL